MTLLRIEPDSICDWRGKIIQLSETCFEPNATPLLHDDLDLAQKSSKYGPFCFVFTEDDTLKGFMMAAWANLMTDSYTLYWLMVEPTCRGRGIASQLLSYAEKCILDNLATSDRATLILAAEHTGSLYERMGYRGDTVNHHGAKVLSKLIKNLAL